MENYSNNRDFTKKNLKKKATTLMYNSVQKGGKLKTE